MRGGAAVIVSPKAVGIVDIDVGMPRFSSEIRTKVRTELLRTGLKVRFKVRIFAEPDFKSSSRFSRSRKVRTKFKPITSAMDFLGILDSFRMNLAPKRSFGGLCAGGKTNKSLIELT